MKRGIGKNMKLNEHLKKVILLIIGLIVLLSCSSKVSAADGIQQIIDAGSNFISQGEAASNETEEDFAAMFIDIGQILVAFGVVTLVIVTLVMAVKWIVAKPDQQAKLKQQLIGLVISAVVIFGAVGIWNLVKGIMHQVEDGLAASQTTSIGMYTYNDDYCFTDNNKPNLIAKEE